MPRNFIWTSMRFMTHMWAMFAVVFLAIYTANLAAFMITREEFHEFSGIDDPRLVKPWSHKPMFKFGSIPWSHTESTIAKYFKEMHSYIKNFSKSSVQKGIEAVIHGQLDAFFYDGTVLDYLVAQDEDCRLLTVGSWYAMTGYGLAFARNSKYVDMFNKRILEYQENGDLERLRRYWMTGTCKPEKEVQKRSDPLALEQFLSVFYLLIVGIVFSGMLLIFEILYIEYHKHQQPSHEKRGCHALLNLSLSKSLDFQGAVLDTKSNLTCQCQSATHDLWRVQYELNLARARIKQLESRLEAYGIESNQNKTIGQE